MSILIVGELINTSRKAIKPAVENKDAEAIKKVAKDQDEAGAHYIDVNCGTQVFNEEETMKWLVDTVQEATKKPLCIDSPNPKAIEVGLENHKNGQPMINSITDEKERYETILPLVLKYKAKVIALCMDDTGMPETADDRIKVVDSLVPKLLDAGVPADDIYLDPLVKPVSTGDTAGLEVLDTVKYIKEKYPEVHCTCGMSNISYGLPNRKVLNWVFMIQTMTVGMDSYIFNPLDKNLMGLLYASQATLGMDQFCMQYLTAHRNGLYEE
ncbi:MAG: 5-methyltetrahydrofolate corrinoid/iron sulfur protein methyltransferase [Clostridia bacterium]|jgi:5-methyltetrahydrofolate--homocysteine methyltransferase|nr:Pterin binding enzyme [Clostridiales bacterium]MDK2986133.1 5-methyltetrahydrofolate corrinoid/iron sulfur protein methyltransferase [Clostridia bacterium]